MHSKRAVGWRRGATAGGEFVELVHRAGSALAGAAHAAVDPHLQRDGYTDLTPSPSVRAMIGRLGFRGWTKGTLLLALPLFAPWSPGDSQVVPLRDLPPDAFPHPRT